jgi:hypothetical protein
MITALSLPSVKVMGVRGNDLVEILLIFKRDLCEIEVADVQFLKPVVYSSDATRVVCNVLAVLLIAVLAGSL